MFRYVYNQWRYRGKYRRRGGEPWRRGGAIWSDRGATVVTPWRPRGHYGVHVVTMARPVAFMWSSGLAIWFTQRSLWFTRGLMWSNN